MHRTVTIPTADDGTPIQFVVRPVFTTAEHIEAQMMLVRIEADELTAHDLHKHVCDRVVSIEGLDDVPFEDVVAALIGASGIYRLAVAINSPAGVPAEHLKGVRRLLEVAYRATEYAPESVCECLMCTGAAARDANCLYSFDRPGLSEMLANYNWTLVAECWDLPFYVYQMRDEAERAASKANAAMHQERKREQAKDAKAAEIRQRVFGTSNWSIIGKKSGGA